MENGARAARFGQNAPPRDERGLHARRGAPALSDARLIEGYLAGESRAIERVASWIRQIVFLRYRSLAGEGADIVQEVHRRLFDNLSRRRFRGEARLRTYVNQTASYTCLDFLRQKRRDQRTEPLPANLRDASTGLEHRLLQTERVSILRRAMRMLPERDRLLLEMISGGELDYRAIGRRLGLPTGTVKSRAFRCRRLLASRMSNLERRARAEC